MSKQFPCVPRSYTLKVCSPPQDPFRMISVLEVDRIFYQKWSQVPYLVVRNILHGSVNVLPKLNSSITYKLHHLHDAEQFLQPADNVPCA